MRVERGDNKVDEVHGEGEVEDELRPSDEKEDKYVTVTY